MRFLRLVTRHTSLVTALALGASAQIPTTSTTTVTANKTTGALAGPVSAATFASANGLATAASPALANATLSGTTTISGTLTSNATTTQSGAVTNAGTATFSGVLAGTPTGGTLNLGNLTLTLPTSPTYTGTWTGAQGGTGVANTGKTITLGGNLTTSGAFATTLVSTANTTATLPAGTTTLLATDGSGASLTALNASALGSGTVPAARMPALTGDITTSAGAVATTLATVNSNVGTFGSATAAPALTVNGKGLITAVSNTTITPAVGSITGLGTGVATLLGGTSSGTGGPAGTISPTFTGTTANGNITASGNLTVSGTGTSSIAGAVVVGATAATSTVSAGTPQIGAESDLYTSINSIAHNNTNGNHGFFFAGKSRGTRALPTIVADADVVGEYGFVAYDGANYRTSARIRGIISGAPGASDLPTKVEIAASPDGSATPAPVATFAATGVAILGTTTNDNAATGYVGEYVSSTVDSGSAVSLTTGTSANITSISLTAGDWDVTGIALFSPNAATTFTYLTAGASTSSAVVFGNDAGAQVFNGFSAPAIHPRFAIPVKRLSVASTQTVYLVAEAGFAVNTMSAYGRIEARRVR